MTGSKTQYKVHREWPVETWLPLEQTGASLVEAKGKSGVGTLWIAKSILPLQCWPYWLRVSSNAKSVKGRRVAFEIFIRFLCKNFYKIVEKVILQDSED